jgi:predicted ATP-grasp superfamily ATP-dependent carboligase
VLFARRAVSFRAAGPWQAAFAAGLADANVLHADLPHAEDLIQAGQPICTVFARAASSAACVIALQGRVRELEAALFAGAEPP